MKSIFNLTKEDKRFCLIFGAMLFLYFFPLLTTNYPVNDDFYRIFRGSSWDDDGRFLASLVHRFLGHSLTIYNPAPLPLILSILAFTFGGLLLKRIFIQDDDVFLSSLLALGFVINPFLLLILVFQLDSIGIALSLVLLIIPFALRAFQFEMKIKYHAACAALVFLSLNSYQASIGFFLSLAFIEFFFRAKEGKPIVKTLLYRMFQAGTGYISYKLFLMLPIISNNARRPARTQLVDFSWEGLDIFISNSTKIIATVITSLSYLQLFFFTSLFILTTWLSCTVYKQANSSKITTIAHKYFTLLLIFSPIIIFLLSFAHLAAIEGFWQLGKLHALTSFSGLTAFLLLGLRWSTSNKRTLYWVATPLIILSLSFSHLTANIVKTEYDYHASTITSIANDLNSYITEDKMPLYVSGSLPRSHYFNRLSSTFPIFKALGTNIGWALMYRLSYSGCGIDRYLWAPEDMVLKNSRKELLVLKDSFFYQISKSSDGYLLTFKSASNYK